MAGGAGPAEDTRWMRVALGLAARGLGRVASNPAVGAVLVRDGRMLGRGSTADGGRPHAEAVALAQATKRSGAAALRGATAYVTLEPCAHHGKTPPCAMALAQAGIARVVCPFEDPDPRVSGRGIAALRDFGVRVETGLMAAEARRLNVGFLSRIQRGRPWLTLKLATTLDGRIATRNGESRWISCPQARLHAHLLRARSDAILVGAGTVRADDPMLDVRGLGPKVAHPVRVVADSTLSLSPGSRMAASAGRFPVWVMHRKDAAAERRAALESLGVVTTEVDALPDGVLDLADVMARLGQAGINNVLCEGGGQMAASLLKAGLVDEIALVNAGIAIGADGIPGIAKMGLDLLSDAPGFVLDSVEIVGVDVLSVWLARPSTWGEGMAPPYLIR